MSQQRSAKQLAKLIDYILSRRPDEFGLVADTDGFIKIKDFLKAVNEEEGLKYVRRSHIDEVLITLPTPPFDIEGNLIRARNRALLPKHTHPSDPPKLLYTCVRKKAYPHVRDKGILPSGYSKVILSSSRRLAERMGRRNDRSAVLLTVQVGRCIDSGVFFLQAGETLFLADFIPPDCFSGPPLPKEKPVTGKTDKPEISQRRKPAGSFLIDLNPESNPKTPGLKAKKRIKKRKPRRERPPWRR
jgi:putative RNA 2'-phosphotransferase